MCSIYGGVFELNAIYASIGKVGWIFQETFSETIYIHRGRVVLAMIIIIILITIIIIIIIR